MEYELQIHPFVKKDGWKYRVIRITDITLHTSYKQPTSIGKKIRQAFKFLKPGRIYGYIGNSSTHSPEKSMAIDLLKRDPELVNMVMDEERNGYKVLLELPDEIPVLAGKDTIEFIASTNGQRIIRGLAKNNPEK